MHNSKRVGRPARPDADGRGQREDFDVRVLKGSLPAKPPPAFVSVEGEEEEAASFQS